MVFTPTRTSDTTGKPHKSWFFTCNDENLTAENYQEHALFKKFGDFEKNYMVIGFEIGATGNKHLQGTITFKTAKRFSALQKWNTGAHWETVKDCEAARNYCMKDDTYFIENNCKKTKRTDLEEVAEHCKKYKSMKQLAIDNPLAIIKFHQGCAKLISLLQEPRSQAPIVHWYYGPTGTGKTHACVSRNPEKELWWSGLTGKWWFNYEQQPVAILDDFRGDFCKLNSLLRILQGMPVAVETKGGHVQLSSPLIIITTPHHPNLIYPNCYEQIDQLLRRITQLEEFYWDSDGERASRIHPAWSPPGQGAVQNYMFNPPQMNTPPPSSHATALQMLSDFSTF